MVLKGSVNFGPRGSTALGFGGHAHRAFPLGSAYAEQPSTMGATFTRDVANIKKQENQNNYLYNN